MLHMAIVSNGVWGKEWGGWRVLPCATRCGTLRCPYVVALLCGNHFIHIIHIAIAIAKCINRHRWSFTPSGRQTDRRKIGRDVYVQCVHTLLHSSVFTLFFLPWPGEMTSLSCMYFICCTFNCARWLYVIPGSTFNNNGLQTFVLSKQIPPLYSSRIHSCSLHFLV